MRAPRTSSWGRCLSARRAAVGLASPRSRHLRAAHGIHIDALERWAPSIELRDGYLHATTSGGQRGARVPLASRASARRERPHGRHPRQGHHDHRERRARARDSWTSPAACAPWAPRSRGREPRPSSIQGVDRLHGAPPGRHRPASTRHLHARARLHGGESSCLAGGLDLVGAFAEKLHDAGLEIEETATGLKVRRAAKPPPSGNCRASPSRASPPTFSAQMMAMLCHRRRHRPVLESASSRPLHAPPPR
jgi:UDP-N-acetylglucosamine 1-carboxyvinyltransferase